MNKDFTPEPVSSSVVKQAVREDLKKRHITHQNIADQLEVKRQTVSNILSSDDYFSIRNAILFSSLLGYNREYLTSGKGSLYEKKPEDELQKKAEKSESLRILYQDATFVLGEVCCIVAYSNDNATKNKVAQKARNLYLCIRDLDAISESPELMEERKSKFYERYNELKSIIIHKYGNVFDEP